jgi:hypothetical protein
MNVDCQWLDQKLVAFFCDTLNPSDERIARSHIGSCSRCREAVEGLRAVDPLVKNLFRRQLVIAGTPPRRRSFALAGSLATATVAVLVLVILLLPKTGSNPPLVQAPAPVATSPQEPAIPKDPDSREPVERAKPEDAVPDRLAQYPAAPPPAAPNVSTPEFLVTDPGGYSRSLADFRNYVLIFGIWDSAQPETLANLETVYKSFRTNSKVRVLGVSNSGQAKPANLTFPVVYNQGSKLLGASAGELLVVDGSGAVRARASLLQDPDSLLRAIRLQVPDLD